MTESGSTESREDVMGAANLFEMFCARTADDMRGYSGDSEPPATSFASLLLTLLAAAAFYIFGKPDLAKATFVVFAVLLIWTAWGVIIRSTERISQKADNIRSGVFPPDAAPLVLARLKWWNHLVTPLHWGRHSRLFDRRGKLDRRLTDLEGRIAEAVAAAGPAGAGYAAPGAEEVAGLAEKITSFNSRNGYELETAAIPDPLLRLRSELALLLALRHRLDEMSEKLERIEKLAVAFQNVSPEDLSQVVSEAIQTLEERRLLVASVDSVDPSDFIDLVTVRV
ncbi:MAG: hypothetical protein LBV15_02835 [Planctomycetota bacterium]|jgi:uncharacterized coiled-coil protein SlyX|nr:hypothetical protein [Planctomycetota bacterium]